MPSLRPAPSQAHRSIVYSRVPWDLRLLVVLVILIAALPASAHALRIAPIAGTQWRLVWITLVFLVWLLAGFRSLRA